LKQLLEPPTPECHPLALQALKVNQDLWCLEFGSDAQTPQGVGYGNRGVACELEVRSSLGFGDLILFVDAEAT
jgi:hypothetical protein